MLKNLKVTTKLVAILVAPVLVLIALAGLGVSQRQADANAAKRVQELTRFVADATALQKELNLEGLYAAAYSGSKKLNFGSEWQKQQEATDAAAARYRDDVNTIQPARDFPAFQGLDLEGTMHELTTTNRLAVQGLQSETPRLLARYTDLSKGVADVVAEVTKSLEDPILARRMASVSALSNLSAARADLAGSVAAAAEIGYFPESYPSSIKDAAQVDTTGKGCGTDAAKALSNQPPNCKSYSHVLDAVAASEEKKVKFDEVSTPNDRSIFRTSSADSAWNSDIKDATDVGKSGNDLTALVPGNEYMKAAQAHLTGLAATSDRILSDTSNPDSVAALAGERATKAQQAAIFYFFFAVASIVVAAAVTYSVARSITVPLRKLTTAAYSLSSERLPALVERLRNPEEESHESLAASLSPIDIDSKDEIGQLADSFNSIQRVTIDVAEEQSVLLRKGIGDIFINLARRNQTLLDRQIEFIDQLEAHEEDPDQLDNLFKLDHLATRMRRNAESLLVLAGAEPPRRRGRPVSLADVVRVAIGEVEDFARIQLLALDEATVGGNVAVDLAHLLSELMENATHFSPPDTMVEIVGHRSANGYIISVSDQGIGMSPEQLAEANHQLARPPLVGLALSRSLGFIVIGRLAQRFDVSVKLTASPSGGVTALVTLPPELVTYEGEAPRGQSTAPAAPADVVVLDHGQAYTEQPSYGQPAYEQPSYEQPSYDQPSYQPGYEEPTYDQPSYQPSYDQPSYQPGYEQPAYDQPSYDQPGYDEPAYEQPSYDQPAYDQPSYDYPAPTQEAPVAPPAETPSYEPVGRQATARTDDEFERGIQQILGDAPAPGPYDAPGGYAPAVPAARTRVQPIQTVAEQITAASRAEASQAQLTAAGLVRRTPKKRADNAEGGLPLGQAPRATTASQRSPEEVRKMLSRYRSGLNKGRNSADPEKADS
jgi:signal transduction histidine kinase